MTPGTTFCWFAKEAMDRVIRHPDDMRRRVDGQGNRLRELVTHDMNRAMDDFFRFEACAGPKGALR